MMSSHFLHNDEVRLKFRCNILISGKIIKEMPGSVASGTLCISLSFYQNEKSFGQICRENKNAHFILCVFVRASLHMRREENPTRCHWMVYALIIRATCFGHLYAHHQELKTICVLLPPMVCDALVAGCRRSGAGQMAMHPGWGMLLEQHPSFRTHSRLSCTWLPTTSKQGIAHHRR